MKKFAIFSVLLSCLSLALLSFAVLGCAGSGQTTSTPPQSQGQPKAATPVYTAPAPATPAPPPPPPAPVSLYWTGDGGKGIRLAILEPSANGLSTDEQNWMTSTIQSSITGDFHKFSDMTIIDRQNFEKILEEQALSMSGHFSDDDYIRIGNLINAQYILAGSVIRTPTAYMLELSVTDVETGERKASYPPTQVTPVSLENLSAVKEASQALLEQLGVRLSDLARQELKKTPDTAAVQAEMALARGINAQRQGTEVAALSYFFQAAAFDPSLWEAASRSSVIIANISSGNIGADIRNDIELRRAWVARLTETEQFFHSAVTGDPPYTLFYGTGIEAGAINYQTETAILFIPINLRANTVWFNSIAQAASAVYAGLNATGRKNDWGLGNWPNQGLTNTNPFASQQRYDISIVFELVNEQNRAIGNQTIRMTPSFSFSRNGDRINIRYTVDSFNAVVFNAVKADDISDNLNIRITSVNGAPPQNTRFQITALSKQVWQENYNSIVNFLRIVNGTVWGFNTSNYKPQDGNLVLPFYAGITSIGNRAFYEKGLTSVYIPNSVTSIGDFAFCKNALTSVNIPYGVTTIGSMAFRDSHITSLSLPSSVTYIDIDAFRGNSLYHLTLPNNIKIGGLSGIYFAQVINGSITLDANYPYDLNEVRSGLGDYYISNGRKAGTYTYRGSGRGSWSYSAQ